MSKQRKLRRILILSGILIGLLFVFANVTPAQAAVSSAGVPFDAAGCNGIGGEYYEIIDPLTGSGFIMCVIHAAGTCPAGEVLLFWFGVPAGKFLQECTDETALYGFLRGLGLLPTSGLPVNYGMERKGICKLMDIEDASLGGTVTAIIKGRPSTLKLKADGKTYVLPVVPGSVVANGDGTYTAQFYTLDPVTGQALVPAGDYTARCHGWGGSNDGGSANTVTIGY